LVKKEDVDSKVTTALNSAKAEWANEQKVISQRRTTLAAASFPVPTDALLGGTDTDFNTRKTRAEGRVTKLKAFYSLSPERVAKLAWEVEDAAFDETVALLSESHGSKPAAPKSGGSPFVTTTHSADKPKRPRIF
jgi:hypothetical protein